MVELTKIFVPSAIVKLSECQYFIGLLIAKEFEDKNQLAATGLAFTFINFSTSWFYGYTYPLGTLTAHAYSTGDTRLCTLYLIRALLICAVAYVPMLLLEYFADEILIALGQNEQVARDAREIIIHLSLGIFLMIIDITMKQWFVQMKKAPISTLI